MAANTKTVTYTEAINAHLQALQIDRLVNVHACLRAIIAGSTGEIKRIAQSALADLEAYGQTNERELREREKVVK